MLGFKLVVVVSLIMAAVCQTTFLFLPSYIEDIQIPYALLTKANNSDVFEVQDIYWPLCDQGVTQEACKKSEPYQTDGFSNISNYWSCKDNFLQFSFNPDFSLNTPNTTNLSNGTFCHSPAANSAQNPDIAMICYIQDSYAQSCRSVEGNHALTFWLYFAFYCAYTLGMNSGYALLDGTALHLADQHDSDYSYMMIWNLVGAIIAPVITGLSVDEPEEGGMKN